MSQDGRSRLQGLAVSLIYALFTTCAVVFVFLNANAGKAELVFWPGSEPSSLPLVIVVFGSFLVGFLVSALFMGVATLRGGADQRSLRRRITSLEEELQRLRNLPIEEDLHAPPEAGPSESESA